MGKKKRQKSPTNTLWRWARWSPLVVLALVAIIFGPKLRRQQLAPISAVVVVPDCVHAVVTRSGKPDSMSLIEVDTNKEVRQFENPLRVRYLRITPDGKQVFGPVSGKMQVWDFETGKALHSFELGGRDATVLADGRRVLVGDCGDRKNFDNRGQRWTIRLWDVVQGKELRRWEAYFPQLDKKASDVPDLHGLSTVEFSPDGRLAIFGPKINLSITRIQERVTMMWDLEAGAALAPANVPLGGYSPDGKYLLASGRNREEQRGKRATIGSRHMSIGTFVLWDTAKWKQLASHDSHGGGSEKAFAPNSRYFATRQLTEETAGDLRTAVTTSFDKTRLRLFSVAGPTQLNTLEDQQLVRCMAFAPDSTFLVFSHHGDKLHKWLVPK